MAAWQEAWGEPPLRWRRAPREWPGIRLAHAQWGFRVCYSSEVPACFPMLLFRVFLGSWECLLRGRQRILRLLALSLQGAVLGVHGLASQARVLSNLAGATCSRIRSIALQQGRTCAAGCGHELKQTVWDSCAEALFRACRLQCPLPAPSPVARWRDYRTVGPFPRARQIMLRGQLDGLNRQGQGLHTQWAT